MNDIELDREGFLKNFENWNRALAGSLAHSEGVKLSDAHWEIIQILQDFYQTTDTVPETRPFSSLVLNRLGKEKSTSIYLMSLFGGSPAKIAAKISGLPKPTNCI